MAFLSPFLGSLICEVVSSSLSLSSAESFDSLLGLLRGGLRMELEALRADRVVELRLLKLLTEV